MGHCDYNIIFYIIFVSKLTVVKYRFYLKINLIFVETLSVTGDVSATTQQDENKLTY